ncbi:MAG: VWA domain-containing protein [Rhodospirillaceae bacterium]
MGSDGKLPVGGSAGVDIQEFLRRVAEIPSPLVARGTRGRLIFAMDATASRQPTWDRACGIQAEMFEATAGLGGLEIQLVYFRGYGECKASSWQSSAPELLRRMSSVECLAGHTQWCRVFTHALSETRRQKVGALVCVGDSMEEDADRLGKLAGELGLLGVPAFMFQEGGDSVTERVFRQLAQLTGGVCCRFDAGSARQLKELLSAVAVYAAGGLVALEDLSRNRGGMVRLLTDRMTRLGV